MTAFNCTGFWWLPGATAARAAGTLHVSSSGDVRLSLIGLLGEGEEGERGKRHKLIHGSVDGSPRGNDVTLFGCMLMGTSVGSYYGEREEYRAGRAFFGAIFDAEDDLRFRSILLKLGGLSEWADSLSGLRRGKNRLPTSREVGKLVPAVEYLVPAAPSGRIAGAKVTLNVGVSTHSRAQAFEIREEANILVEFDHPRVLSEIDGRYVYPLQNLLTFSTDRPQTVDSMSVWVGDDLGDWENNPEIRMIGARVQPEEEPERAVRSDEMLLTLADVDFAPFVDAWLRLADRYDDVFNIYFGSLYGPPAYIDMTYALVAQSLSLYYARTDEGGRHREEEGRRLKHVVRAVPGPDAEWVINHLGVSPFPSLQSLLHRLLEKHGPVLDPLIAGRREALVNQSAATLRYIERRERDEQRAAAHGSDLYWLIQKLRYLLKCCLLSELGFGHDRIGEMVRRNSYFQHIASLETRRADAAQTAREVDIGFEFVVPADAVLENARRMVESTDPEEQQVGRAVLEFTDVTSKTKAAVEDVASEERYDLSVYFDFEFGESIEAAKRLRASPDNDARNVAETLLGQAEAVANSKLAFLHATKRS